MAVTQITKPIAAIMEIHTVPHEKFPECHKVNKLPDGEEAVVE